MSEGLTRRRGGAGGGGGGGATGGSSSPQPPSTPTFDAPNPKRQSLTLPANPNSKTTAGNAGGSGAVEGRGKIAFDPRDYENGAMGGERERMPRLTVMEEVLLLGLKDKQVSSEMAELLKRLYMRYSATQE